MLTWKTVVPIALVLVLLSPVAALNVSQYDRADLHSGYLINPVSPEFFSFMKYNRTGGIPGFDKEGHSLGLIPSPVVMTGAVKGLIAPFSSDSRDGPSSLNETKSAVLASIEQFRLSPVNPEFSRFIEDYNAKNAQEQDQEGHSLGLIPVPIDIGVLTSTGAPYYSDISPAVVSRADETTAISSGTHYPKRFDLRTAGKLTPVRKQEQCGSCWAFSTFGSLESTSLPGTSWDFSENNMKNTHGFDLAPCSGGNYLMSTAYLSRWAGAVSETADPYRTTSGSSPANLPVVQHIQDVIFLPSRTGANDNAQIKELLQQNGAVYSQIRWESGYFRKNQASYYYPGDSAPNHAIVIVGWDDDYSKSRFATTPAGDGAFIVRNSWGEDWGEDGYFYVSYYDTKIGRPSAQYFSEDPSNYDYVYQYDPLGWVTSAGVGGNSAWFANIFTSARSEDLEAVGLYTPVPDAQYTIEVYSDVQTDPRGKAASVSQSGTVPYAGYHTVMLSTPVTLQKGHKFSVVVYLKTPGTNYPIAVEYPYKGYSSKASARSGDSWVSSDGTSWSDLTTVYPNSNVCLKAFTRGNPMAATPTPTTRPTAVPTTPTTAADTRSPSVTIVSPKFTTIYAPGESIGIEWSAKDNTGVARVTVEYSADREKTWITILQNAQPAGSCSWTVPDNLSGSITIRVTATDAAGNTGSSTRTVKLKSGVPALGTVPYQQADYPGAKRNITPAALRGGMPAEPVQSKGLHPDLAKTTFIPPVSHSSLPKGILQP